VLLVLVAGTISAPASARSAPSAAGTLPTGSITQHGWSLVRKDATGLDARASFDALVSNGDALLLAGARPRADDSTRATIWRSRDGLRWTGTAHPSTTGTVTAIAVDGDTALATGNTSRSGESDFVWRSDDGGASWTKVAGGKGVFGTPAPEMGRPNVSGLLRHDGWWVASGGRSDGYAAIWVSRAGTRWRQVLGPNVAGAASIVPGRAGSLLASWSTIAWFTRDVTQWGAPQTVSVPDRSYVSSVARGATTAIAENLDRHGQPTPLLRSRDGGRTWSEDARFLATFADARVASINRAGGLWVGAGASGTSDASGTPSHVDAWISSDRKTWTPLPDELYGGAGGTLSLVAAVDGRVVVVGTAGELDRYYLVTRDALAG
jgi:hypothetical protein